LDLYDFCAIPTVQLLCEDLQVLTPSLDNVVRLVMSPDSRLFWAWCLSYLTIAACVWKARKVPGSLLSWLFPARLLVHRSTGVDLQVLLAGAILAPARWAVELGGVVWVATAVIHGWNDLAPQWEGLPPALWADVLCSLVLLMSNDLAMYWNHRVSHAVPVLWSFHSVHHTAEVLTPLTNYRKHPVYDWTRAGFQALLIGPVQGSLLFLFDGLASPLKVLGFNVLWLAFVATTANLRHSHVPLRFGPVLGRIFSSPSQHHLHHSRDPRHARSNFGTVFSLWDWLFGSLILPVADEEVEFGVESMEPHRHLVDAWWRPFADIPGTVLRRRNG